MGKASKRISIDQVTVGMFLEDVFDDRDVMLFAANTQISDQEQIRRLKERGVSHVFINVEKGADVPRSETPSHSPLQDTLEREAAYYREIERAKTIHRTTVQTIRATLEAIRRDTSFTQESVEAAAEGIVASIDRNPDALISLSQIKGYDEYTYVHSVNVGILVSSLARELEYRQDDVLQVAIGGLLHDIGKMRVPESILNKPGKYVDWEFNIMKKHPVHGLAIINERKGTFSDMVKHIIGQHHERYNGKGYPLGLKGKQIREVGIMGAVADVYDALTTDRVYRPAWRPQKALAHIFKGCDVDYARYIVERFTKYLGIYPVGSFIKLQSGEMGVVIRVDRGHLLAPRVLLLFDRNERRLPEPIECDLYERQQQAGNGAEYQIEMSVDPKLYRVRVADYILPANMT